MVYDLLILAVGLASAMVMVKGKIRAAKAMGFANKFKVLIFPSMGCVLILVLRLHKSSTKENDKKEKVTFPFSTAPVSGLLSALKRNLENGS